MDLRVFFYRKFVVEQRREKGIAREFLEKNEKTKKRLLRAACGKRKAPGSMASIDPYSAGAEQGIKKHLLCHIENVGATIGRPPT